MSRNHPAADALGLAAMGHDAMNRELEELKRLGLPSAGVDEVRRAVTRIRALRADGERGAARQLAQELGARIAAEYPDVDPPERENPRDLAARVPRVNTY